MGLGYTQCISKSFLEESPCQSHCDTYSLYYTTCDLDLTATGLNRLTILRHFLERSGEARERSSSQFHPSPSLWAFLQTETSPQVRGFPMLPAFGGIPSGTPSCTKSNEHLESLKTRYNRNLNERKQSNLPNIQFQMLPSPTSPEKNNSGCFKWNFLLDAFGPFSGRGIFSTGQKNPPTAWRIIPSSKWQHKPWWSFSPQDLWQRSLFLNGRTSWLINGGYQPLFWGGWSTHLMHLSQLCTQTLFGYLRIKRRDQGRSRIKDTVPRVITWGLFGR